jgi:TIR domain
MSCIFISYRRKDTAGYAGWLADRLGQAFSKDQIFRDLEDIEAGKEFTEVINKEVESSAVLLALIGPDWLCSEDEEGRRRLDDPQDFVRLEIASALKRKICVVPVLVGGATMPTAEELPAAIRALARRQAHELSDRRWDYDLGELVRIIRKAGVKRALRCNVRPVAPGARKRLSKPIANLARAGSRDRHASLASMR